MKKVISVIGTRPEAVKMCPLIKELGAHGEFFSYVCLTGQHEEMAEDVLLRFGVKADENLHIMRRDQTPSDITSALLSGFKNVLLRERPDYVLVHGDTTSAFACALASFYERIPVCHIEAGLRTYDKYSPYPEEFNRTAIDSLSDYLFAPTERAKENLLKEGRKEKSIFVTGNTAIDALKTTVQKDYRSDILSEAGNRRIIVVTAHRRENQGEKMVKMLSAVRKAAEEQNAFIVLPMHKSGKVREAVFKAFDGCGCVSLTEPLDVFDFHNICARAYLCVTDSGGIQEEAPSLSLPVLIMRDTTERPEAIMCGAARLCGTDADNIYKETLLLLSDKKAHDKMTGIKNPYGDGNASLKIVSALL